LALIWSSRSMAAGPVTCFDKRFMIRVCLSLAGSHHPVSSFINFWQYLKVLICCGLRNAPALPATPVVLKPARRVSLRFGSSPTRLQRRVWLMMGLRFSVRRHQRSHAKLIRFLILRIVSDESYFLSCHTERVFCLGLFPTRSV